MERRQPCKTKLRFKILLVLILIGFPFLSANAYTQTVKVSLSVSNATLEEFFQKLEQRTDYVFLYKDEVTKGKNNVTLKAKNKSLKEVLSEALDPIGLSYTIDDNVIIINSAKEQVQSIQQNANKVSVIKGVVRDSHGETLPGVSVVLKGLNIGVSTDIDGRYELNIPQGTKNAVIVFSFVGMDSQEVKYTGQQILDVVLKDGETQLQDVVVEAGIIQRNKMGFTGAFSTVTQKELKSVGNTNVLQSLKSLDPSFVIADDIQFGSDPNVMANIQIRGASTMDIKATREQTSSSATQPLFIIDGFEGSIQEVNDMDINRIESMTILKDAGSTAIYGAKGANGVVIIETVKPQAGAIMIDYTGDYKIAVADLSEYNLMNAREKLLYEKEAGYWGNLMPMQAQTVKYYDILRRVEGGVDTYWLKEPIRPAFTHNHSIVIQGGDSNNLTFSVGANYQERQGVMKDSGRETYGANFKLVYRGFNKLNISNNATVSGSNANNGAWTTGNDFSQFVQASPYYKKTDENGVLNPLLTYTEEKLTEDGAKETLYMYNPLYNASLSSYSKDRNFYFTNNTNIDWYVNDELRFTGLLSLKRSLRDYDKFIDPMNSQYRNKSYDKKGSMESTNENEWSVTASIRASYAKSIKKHNLSLIAYGELKEVNYRSKGYKLEGFAEGAAGVPSFGSYVENGTPPYKELLKRTVSGVFAFNYNYDYRYLFDVSFNEEGSTSFGKNNKFQNFWSVGLGWNLDREEFAKNWKWLSNLKISGSMGINAYQSVNAVTTSLYSYLKGNSIFGQGAYLYDYGNPLLDWSEVKKTALTVDGGLFDKRLTFNFGYYYHMTDPMVINLPQKPSTGVNEFSTNLGTLETNGLEFTFLYYPIFNRKENIMLGVRLMGAHKQSKYDKMADALNAINNEDTNSSSFYSDSKSLVHFQDGYSPTSIWAVRSAGVDPATGQEIYIKKDGSRTYQYDINDRVKVGDSEAKLYGTIGLTFIYKKLEGNFILRYSVGGDKLNNDLYNKVENITKANMIYNQDKRALYDRWKNPGDIAEFTSIKQKDYLYPLSSRFVQRNNYIKGESAKISWDFSQDPWIHKLGLKNLKLAVTMNDIFYISKIKVERSTAYPFERAVSLNLSARF